MKSLCIFPSHLSDTCTSLTHLKLRGAGIHGDFLSINCLVKHGKNLASISLQVMPSTRGDNVFNKDCWQKMGFSNHPIQSWNLHTSRTSNFSFANNEFLYILLQQDCDVDISPLPWDYKANRLKSFELIGGKVTKMALFISFVRTAMPVIVSNPNFKQYPDIRIV